jgi:hypothetical protein
MTRQRCMVLGIVLTLLGTSAALAASSKVLFVLDGSGSMQAKLKGRPKIEVARTLLGNLMKSLPAEVDVGLATYGHTRKNDCSDIEILVPPGNDRTALIKAINTIHPKGMTPLTEAMRLAAGQFQEYEGDASVVMVSDGKETCEGDPCAAVREALKGGIRLKVHVIGFDVTPEEAEQLKCMAREGHGKYFAAANATDLGKALAQVKPEIAPPTPSALPKPPAQPKQINLLDSKNGGQVIIAPDDLWIETIDGKEGPAGAKQRFGDVIFAHLFQPGEETIFAFKDEQPATFATFMVLIPRAGKNLKEFALHVADESPTGPFRSIGKFSTVNSRHVKNKGYQEFKFSPVTAKYLKVTLLSGHEQENYQKGMFLYEFRLLGTPQE